MTSSQRIIVTALLLSTIVAVTGRATQEEAKRTTYPNHPKYDDIGANVDPHPDPNEEHYDNMIYIGRYTLAEHDAAAAAHQGIPTTIDPHHVVDEEQHRRLGFEYDNGIKYIFGTSLQEDALHKEIPIHEFHPDHHHDLPDRDHVINKSREEVLRERRHNTKLLEGEIVQPKPYGHVDTHPLDGGVSPPKVVHVQPFFLDATLVTNKEFSKFARSTYYETEAEKFGWSFVLASFLPSNYSLASTYTNEDEIQIDPEAEYWVTVKGAYWRQPEGPESSYKFRENHPVTHVSHRDAAEYCKWKGKRLPGEREYEAAARGGYWYPNNRTIYTWGDEASWEIANQHANLWGGTKKSQTLQLENATTTDNDNEGPTELIQVEEDSMDGTFPWSNLGLDGWRGTSPATYYPANNLGFYDMIGNVWEWQRGGKHKARIVRGASYVDSLDGSFNHAATLGSRETVHGTTTTGNIGFRCAKSPKKRVEYHYVTQHEELSMPLAIEDQFGRRDQIPIKHWEDQFVVHEDDVDDEDDDDDDDYKPKPKKKVIKKHERLSTEL